MTLDMLLLVMRFTLALITLLFVGVAGGLLIWFAKDLDKLTLTLGSVVLTALLGELKAAFSWFYDGVAKTMAGATTTTTVPDPQPVAAQAANPLK